MQSSARVPSADVHPLASVQSTRNEASLFLYISKLTSAIFHDFLIASS